MTGNRDLFINGYLDSISEKFPQSNDPGKNRNLAFEILALAGMLDKPFEEVHEQVQVPGPEDGGFDGIYFEEQGDSYLVHVFQCKNANSLSQKELDKFRNNFREIFQENNQIGIPNISGLQRWIDEYVELTKNGYIIDARLYFVFNGLKDDPQTKNATLYENYNDPENGYHIIDIEDLYRKISRLGRQKRAEIAFVFEPEKSNIVPRDSQALYTYTISNIKAANFRIKVTDLCRLIEEEEKKNGTYDFLFEENIRSFLGYRAKANQRMRETLKNQTEALYFPFLNNGVTIICDEMTVPTAPQAGKYIVPVKNPQIVNGLQTSIVLYRIYKEKRVNLEDVYVNIRLYETRDQELLGKITDATNTQTPINYRDKVSTKKFTDLLRIVFENMGIGLISKRGEAFSPGMQKRFSRQVNIDTVIKFWYATFFERPDSAKDSLSRILQEVYDATTSEKHHLRAIFEGGRESPVYSQMLKAYEIYRLVQKKKAESKAEYTFVVYADELIAYGLYRLKQSGIHDESANYKRVLEAINESFQKEKEDYAEKKQALNISSYFKSPRSRIALNQKLGVIETDNLVEELKRRK